MDYFSIVLVGLSVAFFIYGALSLNKTNQTESRRAKESAQRIETRVFGFESVLNANIKSVGDSNQKVQSCIGMIESLNKVCQDISATHALTNNKYFDLQQKQIELQEKLSNKRPILRIVESKGRGMSALLKPRGRKAKGLDA